MCVTRLPANVARDFPHAVALSVEDILEWDEDCKVKETLISTLKFLSWPCDYSDQDSSSAQLCDVHQCHTCKCLRNLSVWTKQAMATLVKKSISEPSEYITESIDGFALQKAHVGMILQGEFFEIAADTALKRLPKSSLAAIKSAMGDDAPQ